MTHDELLAEIDKSIKAAEFEERWVWTTNAKALRAVVELHKPVISQQVKDTYPNDQKRMESEPKVCKECSDIWEMDLGVLYPCPTIQAIMEQLK